MTAAEPSVRDHTARHLAFPLRNLERRLRKHAFRPGHVVVLSDQLPDRGRHTSGRGESETFHGAIFADLVAYADVLARRTPTTEHR
ncbi:hypothetical protein [Prescottella subtropica]|uniref:hypothetical protein n=1 Tax=Prescottella subtropica TaxID=2545757 RepID=UPI0010F9F484|nr:hypothetical protein [Prescottella subtropica]